MKIVSWGIIFVIVIFSFSFVNRVTLSNKMEIMKEEVKYNNAMDQATIDATDDLMKQMINYGYEENETHYMVLRAIDKFFETYSLALGYYGGENKQSSLKIYIPAISVVTYDGFYIYSLEQMKTGTTYYLEHTLKPEIPFAVVDKKTTDINNNVYINFTLKNTVKVSKNSNEVLEGKVVDLNNYKYILGTFGANDYGKPGTTANETMLDGTVVKFEYKRTNNVWSKEGTYNGKKIKYTKSFEYFNEIRYLYEQWYIDNKLVERRTTKYSQGDYDFTVALSKLDSYYSSDNNYLTQGNPENEGWNDPFTGLYEMGKFHQVRRQAITGLVMEKLENYVMEHNRFAKINNISYSFSLPSVEKSDWENSIEEISIFAFVQGIPLAGESFYNNYGLSGARIVRAEKFFALPGARLNDISGIAENSLEFPIYYSSYSFQEKNHVLIENMGATLYYTKQDAANRGYFPNIYGKDLEDEINFTATEIEIKLHRGEALVGYTPMVVKVNTGKDIFADIKKITYKRVDEGATPNYYNDVDLLLGEGIEIKNNYDVNTGDYYFNAYYTGRYIVALETVDGIKAVSNTVYIDKIVDGKYDINGDGKVNKADLTLLDNYFLRTAKLTPEQFEKADLNKDGNVDVTDFNRLRNYVNGNM